MPLSLASKITFDKFCTFLDRISKAPSAEKNRHLDNFIEQCRILSEKIKKKDEQANTSFFPILRLLLPQLDRDRGSYGLKETALAKMYVRVLNLGKTLDAQGLLNYKDPASGKQGGGDFADIAYSILVKRVRVEENSSVNIEQINQFLDSIAEKNAKNESKDAELQKIIDKLTAVEQKWFIRILLKNLRLGITQNKIFKAYHSGAVDLFNVNMSLGDVCDKLKNPESRIKYGIELFSAFKPMLLERCKIEETGRFFTGQESYYIQTKHDGERFQIHMGNGRFKYFSRNAYDFTETYGESESARGLLTGKIMNLLNSSCHSFIIDGEMMGWHKVRQRFGSKGMSFDVKKMTPTSAHQPCFIAFDIIMYNDELLVEKPLTERLEVLKSAFKEEKGVLMMSRTTKISSKDEIIEFFNKSMDTCEEGIVLKECKSTYKPGVRDGSKCYKIKAEYSSNLVQDIDLVIVGGYYGEGRFRARVNSFLVAVANPQNFGSEDKIQFYAVSSVRTGVTIESWEELLSKLEPHWVKQCPNDVVGPKKDPPNLWIEPKNSIVLTLRATELVRSSSYPTGYSLRFPRIVVVRKPDEKSWRECCTTKEFRSLVKDPGVIQKLTKRHVTGDDIDEGRTEKSPRKTKGASITVVNYASGEDAAVVRISRLLDGKEICVLNGNDEISKQEIEKIVRQHGGNVVQNPGRKTFCVIVGNPCKYKAKNLIQSKKYDVATLDWFLRAVRTENIAELSPWVPWELLSATKSTRTQMSTNFDPTYDSYMRNADAESLKRSLEKAEELVDDKHLTIEQYKEMNRELFDCETSPFSMFRGIVGYFCSVGNQLSYEFRFMGGTAAEVLDNQVTHVFAEKTNFELEKIHNVFKEQITGIKILEDRWITECFRERRLLPEADYLLVSMEQ